MKLQVLFGKLFATTAAKTTAIAVAGVLGGAAVSAGVTHAAYEKKVTTYEQTINELGGSTEAVNTASAKETPAPSLGSLEGETIRVYDGMVQIWDGENWNDYASVDEIESQDPFNGSAEKRAAVELEVLNEKLAAAGLKVDEATGAIVADPEALAANGDGQNADGARSDVYMVGSIVVDTSAANNKKPAGKTPETAVVVPGTVPGMVGALPATPAAATPTQTWTPSSEGSGGGSSEPEPSYSAPSSSSSPAPSAPEPEPVIDTPSNDEPASSEVEEGDWGGNME